MALNAEDIFALFRETTLKFQETDRLVKELAVQSKETDRKLQETDQIVKELAVQSKETDRKFQETDRKFQETDRKFQETDRIIKALAAQSRETDRLLQETDQEFRESSREFDRRMKLLDKNLGKIGNRLGQFVEEMIQPAIIRLFQARGVEVRETMRNLAARRGDLVAEVDLFAIDTWEAVAVEVKSDLTLGDVDRHLQRLGRFKQLFLHYAQLRIYGAVAGMVVSAEVARYAESQGLFVLQPSGEHIIMSNAPEFSPRSW